MGESVKLYQTPADAMLIIEPVTNLFRESIFISRKDAKRYFPANGTGCYAQYDTVSAQYDIKVIQYNKTPVKIRSIYSSRKDAKRYFASAQYDIKVIQYNKTPVKIESVYNSRKDAKRYFPANGTGCYAQYDTASAQYDRISAPYYYTSVSYEKALLNIPKANQNNPITIHPKNN